MRCWLAIVALLAWGLLATASGSTVTAQPGTLLVAREQLRDIRFRDTIVLVVRHDPQGAAGLILNRPSRLALAEALPTLPALAGQEGALCYGGPVAPRAFSVLVKAASPPDPAQKIFASTYLTGPVQLTAWLAEGQPDAQYRVFVGYAGWGPGQLEGEMGRGDWQMLPADEQLLFAPDVAGIWQELVGRQPVPAR